MSMGEAPLATTLHALTMALILASSSGPYNSIHSAVVMIEATADDTPVRIR